MTNTLSGVRERAQPHTSLHQHLAAASATALVLVSAGLGAFAGWEFGMASGVVLAVGLAIAAVAAEILKPFVIASVVEAARRLEFARMLTGFAVAVVCVAFSVTSHIYLATTARSDMAAKRTSEGRSVSVAWKERDRAYAELIAIGSPRAPAELRPHITSAIKMAGNCGRIETATQREACKTLPQLQAEVASYERKVKVEATLVATDQRIQQFNWRLEKVADPLASAVAAYLTALGHPITPEKAAPFLALVPMMLLEVGSMFAIVATRRRRPDGDDDVTGKTAVTSTFLVPAQPIPALPAPVTEQKNQPTASVRHAADRIVAIAKERGGTLQAASKREVARLIDASPPTTSRALSAMTGIAAVTIDQSGVIVRLIT